MQDLNLRKIKNLAKAGMQYALKKEKLSSWPAVVKIDISPLCNLECLICVHADPGSCSHLKRQIFHAKQRMPLEKYRNIIEEIKGKTCAVSLYFLGDPFMHPDLLEMCGIAKEAGLNVHISTNFSYNFSDEKIERIARSGITHMTVCVDGITQETYEKTRIKGSIQLVFSNLKRLCQYKASHSLSCPEIEIQYIKFQHNLHELDEAKKIFKAMGINYFYHFWGDLHNYSDIEPGKYRVYRYKSTKVIPQCLWPYFFMLIKYNGDVLPCCFYRVASQYSAENPSTVIGNVFEKSVWEVWNSLKYQEIRRLVSSPGLSSKGKGLKETFCDGCYFLTLSDFEEITRRADKYRFEDVYAIDKNGKAVRK
ncbi:MAG: SPASM domain-containing protein [Candidatus Aureabacteria bacterium]|nr:SPASM domain-containing protein [Candidatus Auribacterota bacterium]